MKSAFSLVELSIVLVILGLLTGGILTGQTLIRAAELRAVTTEFQRYQSAVNTFRDKYFALPGDMRNATDFWGIAAGSAGNDSTCFAASNTGVTTCNGNGDGRVGDHTSEGHERFRAWQQLANAGLIEGTYSGAGGGTTDLQGLIGVNVPRSKLNNAGWYIRTCCNHDTDYTAGNTRAFQGTYGNMFDYGAERADNTTQNPVMAPGELWNIDTKLDDGMPGLGMLAANTHQDCTLAADETDVSAAYDLSETAIVCSAFFRNAF